MTELSDQETDNLQAIAGRTEKLVTYSTRSNMIAIRFREFANEWDIYFSEPIPKTSIEFVQKTRYFMAKFGELITDWVECSTDLLDNVYELSNLFDNIIKDKYNDVL